MTQIITRFAPSPTGMLHIGSARTALFNWLYSKHCDGKYFLRIEDTDKARSTPEATKQVIESLEWLGLDCDGDIVIQSERVNRHREVAEELVRSGMAYYCYMTQDELAQQKEQDEFSRVKSPWRDQTLNAPQNIKPVVRLKVPEDGITIFNDTVQGEIQIDNSELTDIIILRSDGTPTYLLAVVVDDYDMGVNYIIRGDDHITNTFKQILIYKAMGWPIPQHAHIPLIHGADGAKLSKRHGALGIEHYRDAGYLPEALCNYLLRLGWGGDGKQELLTKEEAVKFFDIADLSKSPARFDQDKLNFINSHYINICDENRLLNLVLDVWTGIKDEIFIIKVKKSIPLLKVRCNTIVEISDMLNLLVKKSDLDEKSQQIVSLHGSLIVELKSVLEKIVDWDLNNIKEAFQLFANAQGIKESIIMQCLRASIIGTFASPGIYDMIEILGKEDCINRIINA
jgi:glutamyl-tRNA synthetase